MNNRTVDLPAFAAVVLAGGRSLRMGRDKAELLYHGRTLLAHMLTRLQECGAHPIVISGPPRAGYATVPDQRPDLGPLGGIHAALSKLAHEPEIKRLLIVPVDMPALSTNTLTALIRVSPFVRACHYTGHPLPLSLALHAGVEASINRLLDDKALPESRRSLRSLSASLDAHCLPLTQECMHEFLALNTPADWTEFNNSHVDAQTL